MKLNRLTLVLTLVAVICALGAGLWFLQSHEYPVFPESDSSDPVVVLKVDRDYAYHIGDLVTINLYVKQMPETIVSPTSLTIDGDFELADEPKFSSKSFEDGSVVYHLPLKLQSFKAQEELSVTGSMSYQIGDETNQLALNPLSIYTSRTWDGREEIMQGKDPSVSIIWIGARFVLPLVIASIVYLFLVTGAFRRWLNRPKFVDPKAVKQERVVAILTAAKDLKANSRDHLELDGLIRENWSIGPIPADDLTDSIVGKREVIEFLRLNDKAVYSDSGLDKTESKRLVELGNRLIQSW